MLVNVYRVRPNDLHKPSDHCDGKAVSCEHVVFYNEHAAALNELSSKLNQALVDVKMHAENTDRMHDRAIEYMRERDSYASRLDASQAKNREALEAVREAIQSVEIMRDERDMLASRLDAMQKALERSVVAIDDWLHTFAYDLCDEKRVEEAQERIHREGGTLYYIAVVQEANRAALGVRQPTWGEVVERHECKACGEMVTLPHQCVTHGEPPPSGMLIVESE